MQGLLIMNLVAFFTYPSCLFLFCFCSSRPSPPPPASLQRSSGLACPRARPGPCAAQPSPCGARRQAVPSAPGPGSWAVPRSRPAAARRRAALRARPGAVGRRREPCRRRCSRLLPAAAAAVGLGCRPRRVRLAAAWPSCQPRWALPPAPVASSRRRRPRRRSLQPLLAFPPRASPGASRGGRLPLRGRRRRSLGRGLWRWRAESSPPCP